MSHRGHHELGVGHAREVDEDCAVAELGRKRLRDGDRETRLPGAAGSRQRDEAHVVPAQHRLDGRDLEAASHQRGGRRGQCRSGDGRSGGREAFVLPQDSALELLQSGPGIDAELVEERAACVAVGVERLLLPARSIEREDLLLAQPLAVRLGCDRDCLYLVTLERGGKPVAARRGELAGGASPATIALPRAKLTAGSYVVGVRLVATVNPGAVTTLSSPPLALSGS